MGSVGRDSVTGTTPPPAVSMGQLLLE